MARIALQAARQLRQLVQHEQSQSATIATGVTGAEEYSAQLARGTTPRARSFDLALGVLNDFVGHAEAQRLLANEEAPRWGLSR